MWILLIMITISTHDGSAIDQKVSSIEFNTEQTCKFARDTLHLQERVNTTIDIGCVKK